MKLTFPTMAEQAVEVWKAKTKTTAFETIAKAVGAFRDDEGATIVWIFPDDTSARITGRGKNYNITTDLP